MDNSFCLPFKVCSYSNIEYKNGNSEKHIIEMADQSQQESRKRIANFYLGNKEKGKFSHLQFLKSGVLRKALFTHFLQSFEDRKTTNKKAGSRRNNLPQAPSASLQVPRQVTGRGSAARSLV